MGVDWNLVSKLKKRRKEMRLIIIIVILLFGFFHIESQLYTINYYLAKMVKLLEEKGETK